MGQTWEEGNPRSAAQVVESLNIIKSIIDCVVLEIKHDTETKYII